MPILILLMMISGEISVSQMEKHDAFGPIRGATVTDGRVYVVSGPHDLVVFDAKSGDYVGSYRNSGEGPGELRAIAALLPYEGGCILHDMRGKLVILDENLAFSREVKLDAHVRRVAWNGKTFLGAKQVVGEDGTAFSAIEFDPTSFETVGSFPVDLDLGTTTSMIVAALDGNTFVFYPWTLCYDHYEIKILNNDEKKWSSVSGSNPLWVPDHNTWQFTFKPSIPYRTGIVNVFLHEGTLSVYFKTYPSRNEEEQQVWLHQYDLKTGEMIDVKKVRDDPATSHYCADAVLFNDEEGGVYWGTEPR